MKIITYESVKSSISPAWESTLRDVLARADFRGDLLIEGASEELINILDRWDGVESIEGAFYEYIDGTPGVGLFIPRAGQQLKAYCHKSLPIAKYGCCLAGSVIAVEYAPQSHVLSTQLHESLHLFGVGECYDPVTLKRIPACDNEKCVMGYGVNSTEVCNHVLRQLRD